MNSAKMAQITANHQHHFFCLPATLGLPIQHGHSCTWIDSGLQSSMFNLVFGLPESKSTATILRMQQRFSGKPWAWWFAETPASAAFAEHLKACGLVQEVNEHALGCQLAQLKPAPPSPLLVEAVRSKAALADFLTLLSPYDAQAQHFYQRMHTPAHFTAAETLFVGYHQGQPVTIATLWQQQTQATIFSLITEPSQQRQGFGTAMMHFLMRQAAQQGAQFLSLSASGETNLRLYQKLGFQKYGEFACYESLGIT